MGSYKGKLLLTMLIFGSIGLFVRLLPFSSAQIAFFRGALGGLCLFLYGTFSKKSRLNWKAIVPNLPVLAASGICMGFNWIALFEAYRYTSITNATLFYYLAPVFVIFLSPILFKEKLTKQMVFTIVMAMGGMALVSLSSGLSFGSGDLKGILLGTLAASLYASVILLNRKLKGVSGLERSFTQLTTAAFFMLLYVLFTEGLPTEAPTAGGIALMLVVGIIHTGIAYLLYFSSLPSLDSQTVAIYSYIDPISAIIFSAVLLKEGLTLLQILGGLLILGATLLPELRSKKETT